MGGSFSDLTSLLGNPTIAQATGVNNAGVVAGFFMDNAGIFHGFLLSGNVETVLDVPGAVLTQAFGLNNAGQVVGDYIDLSMVMHGFIYNIGTGTFATVDDPLGAGTTTINGINDLGQIVGFYVDGNDNTIGFVGTPTPEPASLATARYGTAGDGARGAAADRQTRVEPNRFSPVSQLM